MGGLLLMVAVSIRDLRQHPERRTARPTIRWMLSRHDRQGRNENSADNLISAAKRTTTELILLSTLTCSRCRHQATETMPTDACQFFYDCAGCGEVLRPKAGDCCVFRSYGSVPSNGRRPVVDRPSFVPSWEALAPVG